MDKNKIINQLAKDKALETIINNVAHNLPDNHKQDLAQDLYLDLLNKPDDLIINLYNANQLNFFLARMVTNSIYSTTSRYYYDYVKWDINKRELNNLPYEDNTRD